MGTPPPFARRLGRDMASMVAVLCLAAALRWWQLGQDSLWLDEIYTVQLAGQPLLDVPRAAIASGSQAPLWFLLTHPFVAGGPAEEFLLRWPAAFAGILTVVAAYALGREMFGRRAALWGAILTAFSPLLVRYSQEARAYSLLAAAALFSLLFLWRYVRCPNWRDGLAFVVSTSAALYTSYFALFSIAAELVLVGAECWRHRRTLGGRLPRRWLGLMAALWSAVVLVALPWILVAVPPFLRHQSALSQSVAGWQVITDAAFFNRIGQQLLGSPFLMIGMGGLFVVSVTYLFSRRRWPEATVSLAWVAIPWLVVILLQPRRFNVRYMIAVQPVISLVVGAGLQGTCELISFWRVRPLLKTLLRGLPIFLLGLLLLAHAVPLRAYYATEKEDWRGVAEYLARQAAPGAVVLCHGEAPGRGGDEGRVRIGLEHYLPRWGREDIRLIGVDAVEEIFQSELAGRQLWGVLWHHVPLGQASLSPGWEQAEFAQVFVVEVPLAASHDSVSDLLGLFLLYLPGDAPRYHTELALAKVAALAGDAAAASEYMAAASRIRPGGSYADRAWERAIQVLEGEP